MRLCHLLVVLVDDFGRYTFHAEDFNLEALAAWVGVFHMCKVLLVDLVHMHRETWELLVQCSKDPKLHEAQVMPFFSEMCTSCSVQPPSTAVAFEMFGFLVRDEDLKVVEVALAIIAPGPFELLVEIGVSLALFRHLCGRNIRVRLRTWR